jgi:uncharacterized membrane protein YkoI
MSLYNGILDGLVKISLSKAEVAGAVVGTALGGLAIHDAVKTYQYSHEDISKLMQEDKVDSNKFIRKVHKTVNVVSDDRGVDNLVKTELKGEDKYTRDAARETLRQSLRDESNAFAFVSDNNSYIIAPKKVNQVALEHELGHIKDMELIREQGKLDEAYGGKGFFRNLGRSLSRNIYDADIMSKEEAAWKEVKPSDKKDRVERAALNSYLRAFYGDRSSLVGSLAGATIGSAIGVAKGVSKGGLAGGLAGLAVGLPVGWIAGKLPVALALELSEKD